MNVSEVKEQQLNHVIDLKRLCDATLRKADEVKAMVVRTEQVARASTTGSKGQHIDVSV